MIEYVKKSTRSMKEIALNEVDGLVLSQLAYLYYPLVKEEIFLKEIEQFAISDDPKCLELIKAIAQSPRFQAIKILDYTEENDELVEKQFAAVTFKLETGQLFIAYRGTDGTILGWKENFNMAFTYPIPAQEAALKYLIKISQKYRATFYVGGHSKGGNLAVYASCLAGKEIQNRLIYVFSYDGPGFQKEFLQNCYFRYIQTKLKKIVPHNSLIGMLLYTQEPHQIIKSNRFFILEHDPFSWQIEDNHFVTVATLSNGTIYTNQVIYQWLNSLTNSQRQRFIDNLFWILQESKVVTLDDLFICWYQKIPTLLKSMQGLSEEEKGYMMKTIKELVKIALKFIK